MSVEGGGREIAYRLFAAEYDDATLSHTESDEERAPNYVVTPTGARVNRLFVVGTLTEITQVNEEMLRARVVDPTGAFVVYAGQYQPDELAFLEQVEPPLFVAVTGKARTFQPDDSDRVYTSIRPESIATVDADTRDRWVVGTAEQTIERIAAYARAADLDVYGDALEDALLESGLEEGLAAGIPLAQDHYGTTPAYLEGLYDLAVDAVQVIAGERDQVEPFGRQPDATAPDAPSFAALAERGSLGVDVAPASAASTPESEPVVEADAEAEATSATVGETSSGDAESTTPTATESTASSEGTEDASADSPGSTEESETVVEFDAESDRESESEPAAESPMDAAERDGEVLDGSMDDDGDDLGDFESGGFDDGMYEMDDEERQELEEEFGAEFSTGAEVGDPGEADIDVPEPDDREGGDETPAESADETPAESAEPAEDAVETIEDETEPAEDLEEATPAAAVDEQVDESDATDDDEDEDDDADLEDVDLQARVVETMNELDDGSGADRSTVIETVADETGATEDDVESAIQDALMGGQCYEPDDETLKAI
ncbi:hypothetical protein ACFOZ7_21140 [Natribaculum luteum]|uniref:Rpa-associated protein n=1 Tax=Natribaculum luteum TaxID=1586232 RepID=A0ABD5P5H0_9EURY|nr:hypothetical protein [Natribaculum luteum]